MNQLMPTIVFGISMVLVVIWAAMTWIRDAKQRGQQRQEAAREQMERESKSLDNDASTPATDRENGNKKGI